ncbi:MAG: hypothetical protein AAB518_03660 [Patescibacteria group bacterium]
MTRCYTLRFIETQHWTKRETPHPATWRTEFRRRDTKLTVKPYVIIGYRKFFETMWRRVFLRAYSLVRFKPSKNII